MLPGALFHELLETDDHLLEVIDVQFRVVDILMVALVLELVNDGFERLMIFAWATFERP